MNETESRNDESWRKAWEKTRRKNHSNVIFFSIQSILREYVPVHIRGYKNNQLSGFVISSEQCTGLWALKREPFQPGEFMSEFECMLLSVSVSVVYECECVWQGEGELV